MKMMKRLMFLAPILLAGCVFHAGPSGWIPARVPLTPDRIAEMKRAGESDATIRRELDFHGVDHKLTADELVEIKEAGAGDALLAAAVAAPVRAPEEARPVYHRHSRRADDCGYCDTAVPVFVATALSLNYIFGRHWGGRYCRPGSRW